MVTAYVIVGVALAAATVWVYTHPETRQDLEQATEQTASKVKSWPQKLTGRFKRKRKGGFQPWLTEKSAAERKPLIQQVSKSSEAFLAWINSLPEEEAVTFGKTVADLTAELGLDLTWVTSEAMENYPDLKAELEGLILLVAVSNWRKQALQDDIAAFEAYQAWQRKPHARSQREFSQRLYSELVAADLASAPPTELFLGSEKKRHSYIVEAIRLAALKDRPGFNDVVRQVTTEPEGPVEAASAAPEPAVKKSGGPKVAAEGQNSV